MMVLVKESKETSLYEIDVFIASKSVKLRFSTQTFFLLIC